MTEAMLALLLLGTGRLSAGTLDALARDAFAFWDGGFRDNTTGKTEATTLPSLPASPPHRLTALSRTYTFKRLARHAYVYFASSHTLARVRTRMHIRTGAYCDQTNFGTIAQGSQPCHPGMGKYVLSLWVIF